MNKEKLWEKARRWLKKHNLWGLWVPGTDPHFSEYLPENWRLRESLTGFTGSAGQVLITQDMVGLWTDSRYHLQGESQLAGSGVQLFKDGLAETPTLLGYLLTQAPSEAVIAVDTRTVSRSAYQETSLKLQEKGLHLDETLGPFSAEDFPPGQFHPIWDFENQVPGSPTNILRPVSNRAIEKRRSKLQRLTAYLQENKASATAFTNLDEIAWLLNIRGEDIAYNPLALSYFYWENQARGILFCRSGAIDGPLAAELKAMNISLRPYEDFFFFMKDKVLFLDPQRTPAALWTSTETIGLPSWPALEKRCKSPEETQGMRSAQDKDAVAMIEFLAWLHQAPAKTTEMEVSAKLLEVRTAQQGFLMESFESIVGAGDHGAIIHYAVNEQSNRPIGNHGFLLVDSGGHYLEGTTDITRTVPVGPLSDSEKKHYTLVLKGHIRLARYPFPRGTKGYQLDTLAREDLWSNRMNYGHGTGHGVGHVLGVHESPPRISPAPLNMDIEPGMILSNEPGYYREGKYGIRLENLILCRPDDPGWLRWETLTYVPFSPEAVLPNLLTSEEKDWLRDYHSETQSRYGKRLTASARVWLDKTTKTWSKLLS
jgi:Xaa-Pro aminopeptidase